MTPEAVSELDTGPQLNPNDAKFHDSLRHLAASLEERQTWSEVGDLGQIGLT